MILKETPLFVVKAGSGSSLPGSVLTILYVIVGFADLESHIHSVVSGLNATSRSSFFELSYPTTRHGSDIPMVIFQTNSVKIKDDAVGIFPLTARLNHGCSRAFNSAYSWREEGYLGNMR